MKAGVLIYHSVFDDEVRAMLEETGCCRYFEIPKAWARNGKEKRFGTHIYPGTDSVILAFVEQGKSQQLLDAVRHFKQQGRQKEHTYLALFTVEEFL